VASSVNLAHARAAVT